MRYGRRAAFPAANYAYYDYGCEIRRAHLPVSDDVNDKHPRVKVESTR
jgi:hypothetical protein